jgi:uncharacterized membrane protein
MTPRRSTPDGVGVGAVGVKLDQRDRLLIAGPLGIAVGVGTAFACPWQLSVLAGWDVAALFVVASVWTFIAVLDPASTKLAATREDDSHAFVDLVMVIACLVSLIGVVAGLAHARSQAGSFHRTLTVVAMITVFLSWFTVHTLFTLRYARLYYSAPAGGIAFPNIDEPPDYLDFAYVSFTVGMTFQVSDTAILQRSIRRTALRHALLSFAFGTAVIGVAINVVGTLIR